VQDTRLCPKHFDTSMRRTFVPTESPLFDGMMAVLLAQQRSEASPEGRIFP
jgi:hypothetical protein